MDTWFYVPCLLNRLPTFNFLIMCEYSTNTGYSLLISAHGLTIYNALGRHMVLIWFGSRAAVQKPSADRSLTVDSVVIHPSNVVRDLGVLLDSELTMKPHINKLVSTCFYHLRRLRQLKRHVNRDVMKQLVSAHSEPY